MLVSSSMTLKEPLRHYEQVLALHPECSEQDQRDIFRMMSELISAEGGELSRVDSWDSRPIANPKAKGFSRAWYFYTLFSAPSTVIDKIISKLRIDKKVIYFHQERLPKKTSPEQHVKKFFQQLEQTAQKEKERLARRQKKQAFSARRA